MWVVGGWDGVGSMIVLEAATTGADVEMMKARRMSAGTRRGEI